jgi:hypothetical protein
MNSDMEKELETEISGVLQELPNLAAPPGFLARTMTALEQPASRRLRPWTQWPMSGRLVFLVLALAVVAGVVVQWEAVEPGLLAGASRRLAPAAAGLKCFWNALAALTGALALAVEHLGWGFMPACLAAAAGVCAVCAGLGAILTRLALARPEKRPL